MEPSISSDYGSISDVAIFKSLNTRQLPSFKVFLWDSYHLCHYFDAFKSVLRKVKPDRVDVLESMMLIQAPTLLRSLDIALHTKRLGQIDAPLDEETPGPPSTMFVSRNEESQD